MTVHRASQATTISAPPKSRATQLGRVLHLINGEHFSGAERVQDLLAMALPEFGFDVEFACLKPGKFPNVRQSVKSPLHVVQMSSRFDIFAANQIVKLARNRGYQILHAHTPRTLMIGRLAAKKLNCPLVYHVHSPVGRDSANSLNNRINSWIEKWSLRGVSKMICVSNSLATYMMELGHTPEKVTVVRNGVAAVNELPQRPAPRQPWTLGTMALFRPRKGTEVLLDALAILRRRQIEVNLRAVGPFETPEYESEIMKRVDRLGIADMITWTGFQTDVNAQLNQINVFVLPSLYGEGLPMVVLEAMANAIPVIASQVEGIPEAVRDGVDGLIFKPGSADDLADKIASLVGDQNRWESMSRNSLQRQREKLSDLSMARGIADVYRELL